MNFLSNFQPSARCRSELTTLGYGGYYREMLIGVGKQLSEEVVPGYSFFAELVRHNSRKCLARVFPALCFF